MTSRFKILAIDLHNTLYDEVIEYGLAMEAAIAVWLNAAQKKGVVLDTDTLYQEISIAHQRLGSDWDEKVWFQLPSLQCAGFSSQEFSYIVQEVINVREDTSHKLTVSLAFENAVEALKQIKSKGAYIYIMTEAVADVGIKALQWLCLENVVDGIYTYPSKYTAASLYNAFHLFFPEDSNNPPHHLKKPNPLLLAELVVKHAINTQQIPENVTAAMVFDVACDARCALAEFPPDSSLQKDVIATLSLKESPYKDIIQAIIDSILYIGDSKFKDGVMAKNANIAFGYAEYGKKTKPEMQPHLEKCKHILYAVTGWDKDTLKLTQEAGRSKRIHALLPEFTFENSLMQAVELF